MDSVRTLEIWQDGMRVVTSVYELTRQWPREELFGLTGQARRAAVSIPANLAEGVGRGTTGDTVRFVRIALGSAYELDTLLAIARNLGFIDAATADDLADRISTFARRISSFVAYKLKQARRM